tara:strand:- start:237 stop:1628 length:1392 start_codon:yes stop_codon:yes gene_type:complete
MDFFNKIGDMFVPKEIAPYLGMIAPMVAPQLGIVGSLALSQLGSFKQHGGKFDPFSAVATGIALASPQARAIREAGRLDPTKGTVGQRLSAGIAQSLHSFTPQEELSSVFRALDPRMSIKMNEYGNYFENPYAARDFGTSVQGITSGNIYNDQDFIKAMEGTQDIKYGKKATVGDFDPGKEAIPGTEDQIKTIKDAEGNVIRTETISGTEAIAAVDPTFTGSNLTPEQQEKFLEIYKVSPERAQDYVDSLARVQSKGFGDAQNLFTKAGDIGSSIAGGIFPGFGEYDPLTGAYTGKFDFGKALQTVAVAGTVGSLKAIGEELKKQKQLDEQKQREIWTTYFKSYERAAGKPYSQSRYPDANIMEKFNRFMLATGGRVGYNLGGLTEPVGIMGSSGVPQGMQVDGRNGTFIPMGVEEKADDVPAMLSKNEFVMTADAVKAAGDGDANVGAQRMYDLMHNLEAQV